MYIKASATYTLTATLTWDFATTATSPQTVVEGYTTTPGARDGRPLVTSATDGVNLLTWCSDGNTQHYKVVRHLRLTHTATTRGVAVVTTWGTLNDPAIEDCVIDGCQKGVAAPGSAMPRLRLNNTRVLNSVGNGVEAEYGLRAHGSVIRNSGGDGVRVGWTGECVLSDCVVAGNTGYGFNSTVTGQGNISYHFHGCVFDDNDLGDIRTAETAGPHRISLVGNVFGTGGGYAVNLGRAVTAENDAYCYANRHNAYEAHSSGLRNNLSAGFGDVTLTADPFVDSVNGDYNINDAVGGGALLRAVEVTL